jgi:protein TonB
MKKNDMFLSILFVSIALHGLVIIGQSENNSRSITSAPENRTDTTIKNMKVGFVRPKSTPNKLQNTESFKPSVKPPPEDKDTQEITNNEETQQNAADNVDVQTGEGEISVESEVGVKDEYDELLAYIKEYINKNLVYPAIARQRNVQGIVTIYFEIEKSGKLTVVAVANSSGSSILDRAAISLIKNISSLSNKDIKSKMNLNVNIAYELKENL